MTAMQSNAALGEGEMRELRALLEKATPGEWTIHQASDGHCNFGIRARGGHVAGFIAFVDTKWPFPDQQAEMLANLEVMAKSRSLLDRLLATLASRDAEAARLREALEKYGQHDEMNCASMVYDEGVELFYRDESKPCTCGLAAALAPREAGAGGEGQRG